MAWYGMGLARYRGNIKQRERGNEMTKQAAFLIGLLLPSAYFGYQFITWLSAMSEQAIATLP